MTFTRPWQFPRIRAAYSWYWWAPLVAAIGSHSSREEDHLKHKNLMVVAVVRAVCGFDPVDQTGLKTALVSMITIPPQDTKQR